MESEIVTFTEHILIDELATLVRWESDRDTPVDFRVYEDGRLADACTSADGVGERIVSSPRGEQIALEVLDHPAAIAAPAFPPHLELQWQAPGDAETYRVDEYLSGDWAEVDRVPAGGLAAVRWQSRRLEDCQTHQFRVVPIDQGGAEGTPLELSGQMVRVPDAPAVQYSFDPDTRRLTVSAA